MVMDLGLEGEQSEGETPEETPLEEQVAPETQEVHASALEAATAGDLKALVDALVRGESTEQTDTLGRTPLLVAVQVRDTHHIPLTPNVAVGSCVRWTTRQTST
jgi:gamma-glutamyl:cysteine ligase YbdK (ATP-grasp superfamily)